MFQNNTKKHVGKQLPTKRNINLVGVGKKPINMRIAIPAIALIILLAAAFSKYAVADPMLKAMRARSAMHRVQEEVDMEYETIASYGELRETYAHYTYSDFSAEELARVDRMQVIELIDKQIRQNAAIDNYTIAGNELTIVLRADSLETINKIVDQVETESIVDFCRVSTAVYDDSDKASAGTVTARIIVYMIKGEEDVK